MPNKKKKLGGKKPKKGSKVQGLRPAVIELPKTLKGLKFGF